MLHVNNAFLMYTCACLPTFILYGAQQTSRCSLVAVPIKLFHSCGKLLPLTFSHRGSYPFSPDHWHRSPPILTHSFLLAMLCRTPAITIMLPTRFHGSMIGRCCDGCPYQPIADRSWNVMCRETVQQSGWTSWAWCLEEGMNATEQADTNTYTHSMGSFSSTKRMGSLLRLSDLLWCIIYVSIVWPSLETCWQRHYSGFWQIPIHSQAFNNTC